jgi:hypothetical protein
VIGWTRVETLSRVCCPRTRARARSRACKHRQKASPPVSTQLHPDYLTSKTVSPLISHTLWQVHPNRRPPPPERLIEHAVRIAAGKQGFGAKGGSQRPVHGLDLETVLTGRGWLWRCSCGRLALHVYFPSDGSPAACRRCCKLDYASRRTNRDLPEVQRIQRLRQRMAADVRPYAALPPRPKWKRRAPWLRTLQAIAEQEDRLARRFAGMVNDLQRRAAVRKLTP